MRQIMDQQKASMLAQLDILRKKPAFASQDQSISLRTDSFREPEPPVKSKSASARPRRSRKLQSPTAPEPRIPTTVSTRSGGGTRRSVDRTEAEKELYSLKKRRKEALEEEKYRAVRAERERKEMLEGVEGEKERRRLERIFDMEREEEKQRRAEVERKFEGEMDRTRQLCRELKE